MKYLNDINFRDIRQAVFFDIETATIEKELKEGSPLYESWKYKRKGTEEKTFEELNQSFKETGALYSPFGKIVAISMGYVKGENLTVKEYIQEDEKDLLESFTKDLFLLTNNRKSHIVGFNSLGFDIPFVMFRSLVNETTLHPMFDVAQQKEWNLKYSIDLNLMLRGTAFTNISLMNAAVAFGLPSPKQNLEGGEVSKLYWSKKKNRLKYIGAYCSQDVLATANVLCKIMKEPTLKLTITK